MFPLDPGSCASQVHPLLRRPTLLGIEDDSLDDAASSIIAGGQVITLDVRRILDH